MKLSIVGIGLLVLVFCLLSFWHDDPPPQDADLIPVVVPVSEKDNAYPVYLKLKEALPQTFTAREHEAVNNKLDGKATSADEAAVEAIVARSTGAVALFAQFSRRPSYQDPHFVDLSAIGPETPIATMFPVVAAARLSSIRAEALLRQGRAPEALAVALTIVDAGRVFRRSQPILHTMVIGTLVRDIGVKRVLQIVESGKLDRARLHEAAARLSAPSDAAAGLQSGLRYEYVSNAHILDRFQKYSWKDFSYVSFSDRLMYVSATRRHSYLFMPNRTKALTAVRFRALVAKAGNPCLPSRMLPSEILPYWFRPNMVGIWLYDTTPPTSENLFIRRCESDFHLTAAAARAALRAYRLDHGRFPASLAELAPAYLPSAPVDPFTGSAPLYSAEIGEIHSAGKDVDGKPL